MKPLLLLAASLASSLGFAQFRSSTRVVEVAVVAKDASDAPITDLRKDDLRLLDNGVPQTILSFDRIGATVTGVPARRISVIVLDALNTSWGDQLYASDAVSQVLSKLNPSIDRIAIFALGDRFTLLHDVSSDFGSLRAAVAKYGAERPFIGVDQDRPPNPLAAQFSSEEILHGSRAMMDPFSGFYREQRLFRTLDALIDIARILGKAAGEKNLIWLTAGFPAPAVHRDMQQASRELAAARVILYPVDVRGLLAGPKSRVNVDSMMELAEQTGGRAYYGDNGIADLVKAALDDSREGYVLTYRPSNYAPDGSPHDLRLKTLRAGVRLRYRPGYDADRAP